ncbi:MAG: aldehyde ferredoxin oxidoreductase family protein [Anaerolineae bacterium]|nr:aldehyde ferredoxin oxidoreductase family protein [Anaerolineae bacterium]
MSYGYHNKILRVNLSTGEIGVEQPGERFFRTYFGGWGMIAFYLLKELPPRSDPLGAENVLVFAPGIITGAPVGGSGRSAVGAKSPLTGGFGAAEVGGFWGAELKRAGWDGIVVTGQAEKPVYLYIKDDQVEIREATHLWGKETAEVDNTLKEELGDGRIRVAQCGIAGEHLVRYACVISDVNRAAGRTGLGAVMGAKRLKAIAVRGSGRTEVADQDRVRQVAEWLRDHFKETWALGLHENGTDHGLIELNDAGGLPTRNFQEGSFEGALKITGQTMTETILVGRDTCYACPITCKRKVQATGRYQVTPVYGGPEYESVAALGSCCGIDDLEAIAFGNQLCNTYGLDTISTGVTIAWAMECFERGLLTPADTGGLELRFGNTAAMLTLIEQIARRQGFGHLLAEGSLRAARQIGRDTERYAMQIKGQEIPMHEPRIKFALSLGYATSPTGADHMHNIHDDSYTSEEGIEGIRSLGILEPLPFDYLGPEKVRLTKYHIDWQVLCNCLCQCMFMPYRREQVLDIVQGVSGWDCSLFELMKVGERAMAMARVFNYREGLTPQDDVAHWRFSTPFESGPKKGVLVPAGDIARAIELYYGMQSWDDQTGAPTAAKLHELGIGWVAALL